MVCLPPHPLLYSCFDEWMGLRTSGPQVAGVLQDVHLRQAVWLLSVGSCWQFLAQTYAQKHSGFGWIEGREKLTSVQLSWKLVLFIGPFYLLVSARYFLLTYKGTAVTNSHPSCVFCDLQCCSVPSGPGSTVPGTARALQMPGPIMN